MFHQVEKSSLVKTGLHGLFPSTVSWVNYSSYVVVYSLLFLLLPSAISCILLYINHRFLYQCKGIVSPELSAMFIFQPNKNL